MKKVDDDDADDDDGRRTARHRKSSTDYVSSGAIKNMSLVFYEITLKLLHELFSILVQRFLVIVTPTGYGAKVKVTGS